MKTKITLTEYESKPVNACEKHINDLICSKLASIQQARDYIANESANVKELKEAAKALAKLTPDKI